MKSAIQEAFDNRGNPNFISDKAEEILKENPDLLAANSAQAFMVNRKGELFFLDQQLKTKKELSFTRLQTAGAIITALGVFLGGLGGLLEGLKPFVSSPNLVSFINLFFSILLLIGFFSRQLTLLCISAFYFMLVSDFATAARAYHV